jgi:TusA-related sulfurtransferase
MSEGPIQSPQDVFSTGLDVCFEVLLYLSSRLARLAPGETLEFIARDPASEDKIQQWCDLRGYTLQLSERLPDGRQRFLIQK